MDIKITYNGEVGYRVSLKTVYDYFIPAKNITFEEFINYKSSKTNKTNAELVYNKLLNLTYFSVFSEDLREEVCDYDDEKGYVLKPFEKVKPSIVRGDMLCPTPCIFYSDSENLNEGVILQSSNLIQNNDDTLSSYNYDNDQVIFDKLAENLKRRTNQKVLGGIRKEESKPLVWIWCKSLCPNGKYIENSIFNLTPFVESINTTETENGASFALELISVDGVLNDSGDLNAVWSPSKNAYIKTDEEFVFRKVRSRLKETERALDGDYSGRSGDYDRTDKKETNTNTNGIDEEVLILRKDKGESEDLSKQTTKNLFENLISPNDVIFISYVSEPGKVFEYIEDFFIDNKQIPTLNWDLIGLVDNIDFNSETETYTQSETVSGRDLMKLLIEDGSYFFMNSTGNDTPTSIFENNQLPQQGDASAVNYTNEERKDKNSMNRIYNGMISSLYLPTQRNIGFIMNLLFSKLCNVEICPDELFEPYGDDRTKYNIPIITSE